MTLEIKVEDEVKKRKGPKRTFEVELEWYPAAGDKRCGVTIEWQRKNIYQALQQE